MAQPAIRHAARAVAWVDVVQPERAGAVDQHLHRLPVVQSKCGMS